MKTLFTILIFVLMSVLACYSFGQTTSSAVSTGSMVQAKPAEPQTEIVISGLVANTAKYSFTVIQNGVSYKVQLGDGAPIGMKLEKPWFDWANNQVVVDSIPVQTSDDKSKRPRVAFKLPSQKLFLISKFSDAGHIKHVMSNDVKRMSFYLVTPENLGEHMPTRSEPYISGSLEIGKEQDVKLKIGSEKMPVKLGFRNATINGFTISNLTAGKTRVHLSGLLSADNTVVARSIVFEPVHLQSEKTLTRSALPKVNDNSSK